MSEIKAIAKLEIDRLHNDVTRLRRALAASEDERVKLLEMLRRQINYLDKIMGNRPDVAPPLSLKPQPGCFYPDCACQDFDDAAMCKRLNRLKQFTLPLR